MVVPQVCEMPGCEARGAGLLACGKCSMVVYCCKEHQQQDWPVHKAECAVFRRLGLRARFYNDEEMLQRFPLGPKGVDPRGGCHFLAVPPGSCCGMCGKSSAEETLGRTECCREVVCDNEDRYPVGSFSRDFCQRSHNRYTLCGHHGVESECTRGVDWRVCPACSQDDPETSRTSDRLWRGLNGYNFYPLLEKDVPKHALCDACAGCGMLYLQGMEGCMYRDGKAYCLKPSCTGMTRIPGMSGTSSRRSAAAGGQQAVFVDETGVR